MFKFNGNKPKKILFNGKHVAKLIYNNVVVWIEKILTTLTGYPITLTNSTGDNVVDYKVYGNSKQSNLPEEYQQVEYIEGTGTQYINTGYTIKSNYLEIKSKIFTSIKRTEMAVFGSTKTLEAGYSSTLNRMFVYSSSGSKSLGSIFNNIYDNIINFNAKFYPSGRTVLVNNEEVSDTLNHNLTGEVIKLFAYYGTAYNFKGRVYSFQIYDDNTLVRNLIPCYRKSDNVIGMYDLVGNEFYINAGTGAFLKGGDIPTPEIPIEVESMGDAILPKEYQQVEYIESTGTQYIDTRVGTAIDLTIKVEMAIIGNQQVQNTSGTIYAGNKGWWVFGSYGLGKLCAFFCSDTRKGVEIDFDNDFHTYYLSNGLQKIDNVSTNYTNESKETSLTLYMFKTRINYQDNTISTKQKIKYCQIYKENVLIRNLIPCYRKSDNVIGMYDLVGNKFYTNAGTGTFIKGEDKTTYKIPVKINGKNRLNKNDSLIEGIRNESPFSTWATIAFNNEWVIANLKPSTTYTISYDVECINVPTHTAEYSRNVGFNLYSGVSDNIIINLNISKYLAKDEKIHIVKTFTTPSTLHDISANYRILAYTNRYLNDSTGVMSTMKFSNIQIEEADKASSFEPYVEPVTANIYLDEPLRKIGDYSDYIDFENQKVVRNVEVIDNTGTLSLEKSLKGLVTPIEKSIDLPTLPTSEGTNIITVDTTINPSNMEVKYYAKPI